MPARTDPTLWDYIPRNLKIKFDFSEHNSLPQPHVLIKAFSQAEERMITILLDTIFHQNVEEFLYVFDLMKELEDVLLSIKTTERKPLLYKLTQLGAQCEQYSEFHKLIIYLIEHIMIIKEEKLPKISQKKTLSNILRTNSKIVQEFLAHDFVYRPQEIVEQGEEQMFSNMPGAHTVNNLNATFDSIQETSDKVEKSIKQTTEILKTLTPSVTNALDSASEISNCIPQLVETLKAITDFTNAGKETLNKLDQKVDILDDVSSFSAKVKANWPAIAACVAGIATSTSISRLLTHVIPLLTLVGLDISIANRFGELFAKGAQTQAGFDNTKRLMIFLASFLGKYSPITALTKITSNMSSVTKEMESLDKLADMLGDVFSEWGLDITSKAKAISELRADIEELLMKSTIFEQMVATKSCVFINETKYKDFMRSYNKLISVKTQVDTGVYSQIRNSNFCAELMNLNTRYIRMKASIDQVRAMNGRRQEPVAILFHGPPNLGKSQLMCYIQSEIARMYEQDYKDKPEYDFMADISEWTTWDQNTTDQYHQGYTGQEIHRVDDLFAQASEEDHADFLNFISPAVFPTRQAELAEKGKPYVSKLILATTNNWPTTSKILKCVDALHRRFTVIRFVSKAGKSPPKEGFSTDFDWITMYQIAGASYADKTPIGAKKVEIKDICKFVIETMKIKHEIFQQALAATQADDEIDLLVAHKSLPRDKTPIMLALDWNSSVKYYKETNFQAWRKLKFLKTIDPVTKRELVITELQVHNTEFNYTRFVFSQLKFSKNCPNDLVLIVKDIDGTYLHFNSENGKLYRTIEILDHLQILDDSIPQVQDMTDYTVSEKLQLYFIKLYDRIYPSFRPIIKGLSLAGKVACSVLNPTVAFLSSVLAVVMTWWIPDDHNILYRAWEVIHDLTNILYLIPALFAIGGLIYYKCRTFSMTEPCTNCKFYIENMDELKIAYCESSCRKFYEGTAHFTECDKFDLYVSYILKDMCVACRKDSCEGNCSHSLPPSEVDPKLLASYKKWLTKYVTVEAPEEIKSKAPTADTIVLNYYEAETVGPKARSIRKNRMMHMEESPSGQKQAKVKRMLLEESPSGQKQAKVKRMLLEESPSGQKQVKIKRAIIEESPCGQKQARVKRAMLEEQPEEINLEEAESKEMQEFKEKLSQPETMVEEYDFGGHNPGAAKPEKIKIALVTEGAEQLALDSASLNLFAAVTKSCFKCTRIGSSGKTGFLFGHAFGKHLVTPSHLHMSSDPNAKYFVEAPENGKTVQMPLHLVTKVESRDVALWSIETKSYFPRRFYDNLITEAEYLKIANRQIHVVQHLPKLNVAQLVIAEAVEHKSIHLKDKGVQTYDKLLVVHATSTLSPVTSNGDCGGILVAYDTQIVKKIIGFHIIGSIAKAFSAIVTKDLIDSMMPETEAVEEELSYEIIDQKLSKFPIVDLMNQITEVTDTPVNLPPGDFEYLGELGYIARPAANTGIKEHLLFGTFEVTSAPANLTTSAVEDKDSLLVDCAGNPNLLITRTQKYGKVFKNTPDQGILDNMERQLTNYYVDAFKDKDIGISSDYEVLNGNPLDPDSHPLDMRTSSGIYWSRTQNNEAFKKGHYVVEKTNEKGEIYKEFDYEKPHVKELFTVMEATEELAVKGYRTLSINKDCFKDELRPIDKLHKPRIFKNVPFDKVLLLRKYAGKFKTEWTKMRGDMFHSVGINTTSSEWSKLYHEMCYKSSVGCDADFGTFDGNLRAEFMEIAFRVIRTAIKSRTKNERSDKILEVLFDEIIRSISVSCSTVYMDTHGNPSGSPFTTITNCIVNFLYHWYCFIRITNYVGLDRFLDTVCIRTFGDDVIYTAHEDIGYTFENIQKIMINELEQDYTDATKSTTGAVKPIRELSFLKRKFRVITPSIVLSPIETKSIEMRYNYTNIPPSDILTHKLLIYEGLLEASMHGQRYFTEFAKKLVRGVEKCGLKKYMKAFDPCYSDYYNDLLVRYQEGKTSQSTYE